MKLFLIVSVLATMFLLAVSSRETAGSNQQQAESPATQVIVPVANCQAVEEDDSCAHDL